MKPLFYFFFCLFFVPHLNAQNWAELDQGLNEGVRNIYYDSLTELIYFSGMLKFAGDLEVNGIAAWDGNQFLPLGSGMDYCATFNCARNVGPVFRYKDELFVSVPWKTVGGGIQAWGLAKWDGQNWLPTGVKFQDKVDEEGRVQEMIVFKNHLYAIGSFRLFNGEEAHGIVRYDGNQWHLVPPPDPLPNTWLPVEALVFEQELYIVGNFYNSDPNEYEDIIKFDGNQWHQVGTNYNGKVSNLGAIAVFENELYIGGLIRASEGNPGNGILKLQGDAFVDVGGSFPFDNDQVRDLQVFNGKLYALGIFEYVGSDWVLGSNIVAWDGTQWHAPNGTFENVISVGLVAKDTLFVGGGFNSISGQAFENVAKWNCQQPYDSCSSAFPVSVSSALSITKQLELFPNPSSDFISLQFPKKILHTSGQLQIIDSSGKKWRQVLLTPEEQDFTFSVQDLPPGLYFVQFSTPGVQLHAKFLKRE